MQVLVLAVQNEVHQRDIGIATSAVNFYRSLGGAFGTAMFGTLLTSRIEHFTPQFLSVSQLAGLKSAADLLSHSPAELRRLPVDIHSGLVQTFVHAFDEVLLFAVPLAVVAFLITLGQRERPLRDDAPVRGRASGAAGHDQDELSPMLDRDPIHI
jgi:hypothetical protein